MAVVLDFIYFIVLAARVVHYHNVIVLKVFADELLIEALGSVSLL